MTTVIVKVTVVWSSLHVIPWQCNHSDMVCDPDWTIDLTLKLYEWYIFPLCTKL